MNKSDWYKLLAIAIVAAFVIEGVALGMMQNPQAGSGSGNGGTGGVDITGQASGNVTIVRYEPYIIVSAGGNSSAVDVVKQKLIEDGVATYAVPSGQNIIVNLASSRSVVSAAAEFEKVNATITASLVISTPSNLKVVGADGITTTAESSSFRMQARPVYEEGSVVPASFVAQVQSGQLVSMGSFTFLPVYVAGAIVQASVLSGGESEYYLEIPWESRVLSKGIAKEAGAIYRERSYVLMPQNVTQQQISAAQSAGSEYVTAVQPGIISVRNDFEDRLRASGDLQAAGILATFPPSVAYFENASGNGSALSLLSKLEAANVSAKLASSRSARVKLPAAFEFEGVKYSTSENEIVVEQVADVLNGTIWLALDFEAAGSRVARVISARQAVAQVIVPAAAEGNGTDSTGGTNASSG